jgi:transcriptional regulator NrdR family protein
MKYTAQLQCGGGKGSERRRCQCCAARYTTLRELQATLVTALRRHVQIVHISFFHIGH